MTKKIIISFGKWQLDRQFSLITSKRNRIFTLGSITLAILSIISGVSVLYITSEKYSCFTLILIIISIILLIFSLIVCFINFKSIPLEIPTFFEEERFKKLKSLSEDELLDDLISNLKIAYTKNQNRFFPDRLIEDKMGLSFYSSLLLNIASIALIIIVGMIELLN